MIKLKRPEKIQTSVMNGTGPSSATSSPSFSAKRPPSAQLPTPTTNGTAQRGASRRRDTPQLLGRGQRMASAGLRSASYVPDGALSHSAEPLPYIQSDAYIKKKFTGRLPSLVVHLHPNHFRFDQQDGTFSYKGPMRVFIEHLKLGTVPHDLLDMFTLSGVTFYDGCLIVEVHDHKSVASAKSKSIKSDSATKNEELFSLHNWKAWLTPSPYAPHPKEDTNNFTRKELTATLDDESRPKTASELDKENMPAPTQPLDPKKRQEKISTIVLHPTSLSINTEVSIMASTPLPLSSNNRRESVITPMSARPQTPLISIPLPNTGMEPPSKRLKRDKMELDEKTIHIFESQTALATTAPLFLNTVKNVEGAVSILEQLAHPDHNEKIPIPKSRKKTVAEMAAEESATKNEQQFMLTMDELRHSSGNGVAGDANPSDADGQAGATSWEPRFESFRVIENIKLQHAENKKNEKIKQQQLEAQKRLQVEQDQMRQRQAQAEAARRQEEENVQRLQAQQQQAVAMKQQQMHNMADQARRRQKQAQVQAQAQAQLSQPGQQPMNNAAANMNHAHMENQVPSGYMGPLNPSQQAQMQQMHAQQQQQQQRQQLERQRLIQQQQLSQAQASSPIVRNATPHNLSSPMVPTPMGAPMQQSTSSMGGSPARPGSVVQQNPQMTPAMSHAMRAQGSQNSHGGTPRPMNATPNMPQAGPRPVAQTPRLPMNAMPVNMGQVPQMPRHPQEQLMMQGGQLNPAQIQQARDIALQQQQQQRMRSQAAQVAMGSTPQGFQMTPQQQMLMQQQMQQHQNNSQMMPGMAGNAVAQQLSRQYAAQIQQMAAAQQITAAMQQGNNNPQNFGPGIAMTPQMLHARQMQQQQRAQAQAQMNPAMQTQQQVKMMFQKLYNNGIQNLNMQWNGNVSEQALAEFKNKCMQEAPLLVQRMRQAQAQQQAQQAQAMSAAGQNMNMMQQGMGRPPGM